MIKVIVWYINVTLTRLSLHLFLLCLFWFWLELTQHFFEVVYAVLGSIFPCSQIDGCLTSWLESIIIYCSWLWCCLCCRATAPLPEPWLWPTATSFLNEQPPSPIVVVPNNTHDLTSLFSHTHSSLGLFCGVWGVWELMAWG